MGTKRSTNWFRGPLVDFLALEPIIKEDIGGNEMFSKQSRAG